MSGLYVKLVEAFIDKADYEDRVICYYYWPNSKYKKKHPNNLCGPLYLAGYEKSRLPERYEKNPHIYPINLPMFKAILYSLSKEEGWPWGDDKWFAWGDFYKGYIHGVVAWAECHWDKVFYKMDMGLNYEEEFFLPKEESRGNVIEAPDGTRKYTLEQRYKNTGKWADDCPRLLVKLLAHSLIAQGLW